MKNFYDACIIGAGPAGMATAITLAQAGKSVVVVEKFSLPRAKVCGGFIGPENRTMFEEFGVLSQMEQKARPITKFSLISPGGRKVAVPILLHGLKAQGWGLSRKDLDQILVEKGRSLGVKILASSLVKTYTQNSSGFESIVQNRQSRTTSRLNSRYLINTSGAGTVGARSKKKLFGIAADFSNIEDTFENVSLYFIRKGHLGVNALGQGPLNVCYVVHQSLFEKFQGDTSRIFKHFCAENSLLAGHMQHAEQLTPWKGIVVSPEKWRFCEKGIYFAGDATALINPVVGGGNSLALASGRLLAKVMLQSSHESLPTIGRRYEKLWKSQFGMRVTMSWILGNLAHYPFAAEIFTQIFEAHDKFLKLIFKMQHKQGFEWAGEVI